MSFPPPPVSAANAAVFPALDSRPSSPESRRVSRAMDPSRSFVARNAVEAARKSLGRPPGGSTHSRRKKNRLPPRSVALSNCFCLRAVSLLVPFSPYRARFARRPLPQGRRGEVCDPRSADGARRGGDGGRGSGCGGVERVRRLQTQRQHFSSVRHRRVLEHPADAALLLLMPVCRRRRVDGVLLVLHGFLNKSSQGRIIERRGKRKNVLLLTFVRRLRASEEKAERAQNEEQGKEIFRSLSLSQSLFALSASVGARLDASVLAFLSLSSPSPREHI